MGRVTSQCNRIVALLRKGRATNVMLSVISLKYTSRISDLRKAGHVIECEEIDRSTGVSWYRLTSSPKVA